MSLSVSDHQKGYARSVIRLAAGSPVTVWYTRLGGHFIRPTSRCGEGCVERGGDNSGQWRWISKQRKWLQRQRHEDRQELGAALFDVEVNGMYTKKN